MKNYNLNVDFESLKNQKAILADHVNLLVKSTYTKNQANGEELQGILELLDSIQDQAVDVHGESEEDVFTLEAFYEMVKETPDLISRADKANMQTASFDDAMKEATQQESNILIAEFMGAVNTNNEYEMYGIVEHLADGFDQKHFYEPSQMEYDTSWDWLMPVVEKIESGGTFIIFKSANLLHIETDGNEGMIVKPIRIEKKSIDAYYKLVVQFIQWYNNQKA
tara:strand:+ start:598 stop:1266 length:669 start_codon:yes stop_codon:yes gene_type:complete